MSVTGGQQTHRPTCPKRWGGGEREREQKGGKKKDKAVPMICRGKLIS